MDWHGFCGASYTSTSRVADAEQLINWYVEQIEPPAAGATQQALYPTPGCETLFLFSDTGVRGLYAIDASRVIAVFGGIVVGLDGDPTISRFYGTVTKDGRLAPITSNGVIGNQVFLASGTNGYTLNLTNNFFVQTLTNKAQFVGMIDGFFLSFDGGTGRIYLSNLNDGMTWDPTQFAQRSTAPDSWKAMIVVPPDIWLIGSVSGDVWFNAGAFPFPLAPRQGLNFKYGIAAPYSLAAFGPTVLWLAQAIEGTGIVVRTVGYEPQRVSTYAVEHAIANYARMGSLSGAEGMVYEDRGHAFYCLRFPIPERTWVYDLTMNTWHERGYWNGARNQFEVWRPRAHAYAFSRHLVGDDQTGAIQVMDINIGTEQDGTPIRRVRRSPAAFSQFQQLPMRVVEIFLESGLGLQSGQGSDPIAMWKTSDDGGRTWGNERQGRAGRVGQYRTRLRFWRNGIPRDRVGELSVSDPVPFRILGAYINNDVAT
jgi:hypothetical protein